MDGVKTPPKPPPDLTDPKVCQQIFEKQNMDLNLYYNPMVMNWWWNLSNNLEDKLKGVIDNVEWDLKVTSIGHRIKELTNPEDQKNFQRRYDEYVELSKVRPFHRSPYFDEMSEFLRILANEIPTKSKELREELDLPEYTFTKHLSEEEKAALEEE